MSKKTDLKKIGFWFLSFVTFTTILLTLFKVWWGIDINWLWVFSPIWIPVSFIVTIGIILFVVLIIRMTIRAVDKKEKELKNNYKNNNLKRYVNRRFQR